MVDQTGGERWWLLVGVVLTAAVIGTGLGWFVTPGAIVCDPMQPATCEPLEPPCLAVDGAGRLWTCEGLAEIRAQSPLE